MKMQVQAVVYNNTISSLKKMVESFTNAALYYNKHSEKKMEMRIIFGEASPKQVLFEKDIESFRDMCDHQIEIDYVNFGFNTGYGKGHNLLSEHAEADFLCIINPDIMVTAPFFCEMLAPFEQELTGITEGRQTPVEQPKEYDKITGETDWCTGACFVIRQSLFREINGFDTETFFMYFEDMDLSWRIKNKGYKLIYCPAAPAMHPKRLSEQGRVNQSETEPYYLVIAQMLFYYKWGDEKKAEDLCKIYKESGNESFIKAAMRYEELKSNGQLPKKIKDNNTIKDYKTRFTL